MAAAAILSREECRDTQRRAESRPRRHARVDHWLETLEERVKDPTPTLAQRTQAVFALRPELTPAVTAGWVEPPPRPASAPRTAACPQCGPSVSARGPQERTVETLVGAIRRRRPDCDGARCQRGTTPLDAALGRTARRQPPDVPKAAVPWPQEVPDATAWERCAERTGRPRRAHLAHAVTPAVAAGVTVVAVAPSREASVAKMAAVAAGPPWQPIRVRASDGADVPARPETANGRRPGRPKVRATRARWTGAWRAAQGCRCSRRAAERIVQVLSWPQRQTDAAAAEAPRHVNAAGVIPEAEVRLGVMADGARWIWTQVRTLCPSAVERWDDDHGRAPRHQVAARPYGAHPERPRAWGEAALARRFAGDGHGVLWGLQRLKPVETQAARESTTLMASRPRHQERLASRFARTGGDPLGSGGMESAHTFICHVRLTRSGAWWAGAPCQPHAGPALRHIPWHR